MSLTFKSGDKSLNVSNSNGYALLEYFGVLSDFWGEIPLDTLQVKTQDKEAFIEALLKPTIVECNIVNCGRSRPQVENYFNFFHSAKEGVTWS